MEFCLIHSAGISGSVPDLTGRARRRRASSTAPPASGRRTRRSVRRTRPARASPPPASRSAGPGRGRLWANPARCARRIALACCGSVKVCLLSYERRWRATPQFRRECGPVAVGGKRRPRAGELERNHFNLSERRHRAALNRIRISQCRSAILRDAAWRHRNNVALPPIDASLDDISRTMFEPVLSDEEKQQAWLPCVSQEPSTKVREGDPIYQWLEARRTE